ncbi:MAG: hypothetical protein R2742_10020 [Micropruina glycogenica]
MLFFDHEPDGQVEHRLQRGDRRLFSESGLATRVRSGSSIAVSSEGRA